MLYLTGLHALNLPCELPTTGDWHAPGLIWGNIPLSESSTSIYGDYGIEINRTINYGGCAGIYNVANHIRVILDFLELNQLILAQGFRNNFFCVEIDYIPFFERVFMLHELPHWESINTFMGKEYFMKWVNFYKSKKGTSIIDKDEYYENEEWRKKHQQIMTEFLHFLNENSNNFVLKGGTALRLCYKLARFSVDIYLDAKHEQIQNILDAFCKKNDFSYIVKKDSSITKYICVITEMSISL